MVFYFFTDYLKAIFNSKFISNVCILTNFKYYQLCLKQNFFIFSIIKMLKLTSLCQITNFIDLVVIDYPKQKFRFLIIYILQSLTTHYRLNVKSFLTEFDQVRSLFSLFAGCIWYERELFDMFGIFFFNNPDLRRILTDYGFNGFPLKKDFPLSGYLEVRYDDSFEVLVYEPVELMQEFRNFEFLNPWEELTIFSDA